LPFGRDADFERRVQLEAAPSLVPRRRWLLDLDWELSVICERAMEKDPARRYRSAAELADDLERADKGLPICAERAMPRRRLAKWVRRHKLLSLAGLLLGFLLLYLPLVPVLVLEQSRSVLIEQNSNAALYQAGAVMNELRAFADDLSRMAEQDEVRSLIQHRDLFDVPIALSSHAAADIENFIVFSSDGILRARWPKAENIAPTFDFSFRDYLRGALRMGREGVHQVYVARAVRSKISNQMVLELTLPMFDAKGGFIGIFGGSRRVRSTFGAVQMNCAGAGDCMTGLLGPRDRDSAEAPLPSAISVAAAPGLKPGSEITWDLALGRRICAELGCTPAPRDQFRARPNIRPFVADYVDPISHIPSLGAFAPVGRTGLVVVVATPHSAVRQLTDRMLGKARSYLGVPVLLGVLLFGCLLGSLHLLRPKSSAANPARA
jgi:serine/threonine-protein kinase